MLLVLAVFLAMPLPTATPETFWKTIVTVKTRPVCSTLQDVIAPAIAGLAINDRELARSSGLFYEAARDDGRNRLEIDMMRLETEENIVAKNIIRIDTVLADPRLNHNSTDDERNMTIVKTRLEAVLAKQKDDLNLISGTVESHAAEQLRGADDPLRNVTGPPREYVSARPDTDAQAIFAEISAGNVSTLGFVRLTAFQRDSPYSAIGQALASTPLAEQPAKNEASLAIVQLASACR